MRIAALAFGVLAGLVASLILALGGLDVSAALATAGDRQVSLIRFGLFVVANLGVFGAALVLAAPLAGAILLLLGALTWVAAALLLHHTTDLVLIVPPALLLVATAFAVVAYLRRDRRAGDDEAARDAALSRDLRAAPEPEDFEELPPVPVGAGFFGQGGTAQPLGTQHPQARDEVRSPRGDDWAPVRRPTPPPRQKSMFRQPDDDEDDDEEPSGLRRFAFGLSGVLSFGLYAALAGAAVLVFLNLRTGDVHPGAAKIAPTLSSSAVAALASSSQPSQAPVLAAAIAPSASSLPQPNPPLSDEASRLQTQTGLTFQSSELPPAADSTSDEPAPAAAASSAPASGSPDVMPFTMSPEMAAQRAQPAPPATRSATPTPDAGL